MEKKIRVRFNGGREGNLNLDRVLYTCLIVCVPVMGILKGYDALLNLVLDDTIEYLRGRGKRSRVYVDLVFIQLVCQIQIWRLDK